MAIKSEILDELLRGADPKKLFEKDGLDELKKALAERNSLKIQRRQPDTGVDMLP